MPELPEVELMARRLTGAMSGARVTRARAPGINVMKTFDPPLEALEGRTLSGVGRRGKMLVVELEDLALLVHLMSAGRLSLHDRPAGARDRTVRLTLGLEDGRELRLREFGTRQRAWAKVLPADDVDADDAVAGLGPEAFPAPPAEVLRERLDEPRLLHPLLRDQRTIAGIGRAWSDDVLWEAGLSPFRKGEDLSEEDVARLARAIDRVLGDALAAYEERVAEEVPDKLPKSLRIHEHAGEPCPRCGTTLEAVHYSDHTMAYCPACQTQGKILKDRRLSRLLK